jgi:hypothetical protein
MEKQSIANIEWLADERNRLIVENEALREENDKNEKRLLACLDVIRDHLSGDLAETIIADALDSADG